MNELNDDFIIKGLNFIRWCKTIKNIYDSVNKNIDKYDTELCKNKEINIQYIIGISALRSFIDKNNSNERLDYIKTYFEEYLPQKLYQLLISANELSEELPFESYKKNNEQFIISKYSGILFNISGNINEDCLKEIKWTKSTIDIADAILISLVSNTILILEGPPGRGKTVISQTIFKYLGIKYKRINFSPSTKKEDVFSRRIPKIENEYIN